MFTFDNLVNQFRNTNSIAKYMNEDFYISNSSHLMLNNL